MDANAVIDNPDLDLVSLGPVLGTEVNFVGTAMLHDVSHDLSDRVAEGVLQFSRLVAGQYPSEFCGFTFDHIAHLLEGVERLLAYLFDIELGDRDVPGTPRGLAWSVSVLEAEGSEEAEMRSV